MVMKTKKALLAFAVGILMGTMAVTALADSTYLIEPDVGAPGVRSDAGELQGPVETGAIPDLPGISSAQVCCSESGDPTFRPGGP